MPAFEKGKSGNPGGRPKEEKEVLELARSKGKDAILKLIEIMDTGTPKYAIMAANSLLDRAFGKPAQPISGDDEHPLVTEIRRVIVDPRPRPEHS